MLGSVSIVDIFSVLVVVLLSMTLHEAMHGFVAYALGDDTAKREGRLTFNPIKHIDPFLTVLLPIVLALSGAPIFGGAKPVPFNPSRLKYDEWGAALVAISGPLTNLLIAFVSLGIYSVIGGTGFIAELLVLTVQVNVGFFAFNIIPIPPLDGSRVLYALAPEFFRRGMEQVEKYGLIVMLVLVVLASSLIGRYIGGALDIFLRIAGPIFGLAE